MPPKPKITREMILKAVLNITRRTGSVSYTHLVSIMSFTIPKLMAEILFTAPTPIIALVFVWVVDTGIPNRLEKRRHIAPARSAEKP